jgi:hypothetical protein
MAYHNTEVIINTLEDFARLRDADLSDKRFKLERYFLELFGKPSDRDLESIQIKIEDLSDLEVANALEQIQKELDHIMELKKRLYEKFVATFKPYFTPLTDITTAKISDTNVDAETCEAFIKFIDEQNHLILKSLLNIANIFTPITTIDDLPLLPKKFHSLTTPSTPLSEEISTPSTAAALIHEMPKFIKALLISNSDRLTVEEKNSLKIFETMATPTQQKFSFPNLHQYLWAAEKIIKLSFRQQQKTCKYIFREILKTLHDQRDPEKAEALKEEIRKLTEEAKDHPLAVLLTKHKELYTELELKDAKGNLKFPYMLPLIWEAQDILEIEDRDEYEERADLLFQKIQLEEVSFKEKGLLSGYQKEFLRIRGTLSEVDNPLNKLIIWNEALFLRRYHEAQSYPYSYSYIWEAQAIEKIIDPHARKKAQIKLIKKISDKITEEDAKDIDAEASAGAGAGAGIRVPTSPTTISAKTRALSKELLQPGHPLNKLLPNYLASLDDAIKYPLTYSHARDAEYLSSTFIGEETTRIGRKTYRTRPAT